VRTELGTRGYMAPEISENAQAASRANRKSYDEKVDTFALGVILFICSSGFPPFRQTNSDDWWFDKIMKKQWHFFWKAHERKHEFTPLVKDLLENMLAYDSSERFSVAECLKHPFFTNNPAGTLMTKEEYITEMKGRYQYVKAKLRAINDAKKQNMRAEPMPIQDKAELLAPYGKSSIPAELLCMNDYRKNIFDAPDPTTDAEKEALSKVLSKSIIDMSYIDLDARTYNAMSKDFTEMYMKMSNHDLASVKNAFCNVQTAADLKAFLPNEDIDPEKMMVTLNRCNLGTGATTEVSMNSVLQYREFDSISLCVMDPVKLEENEGLIFNVKYGFGTFVHFMKDLHAKTPQVTIDVDMGSATVNYEISDTMVLGDEEVTVTDQVQLLLQMFAFDNSHGQAPPGFAITIRPAGFLQTHLHAFDMCWKKMIQESNFLNPLFVYQKE